MAVRKRVLVLAACVLILAGVMTGVGVHLWQQHKDKVDAKDAAPVTLSLSAADLNVYITDKGKTVYLVRSAVAAKGRYKELGSQVGLGAQGRARACPGSGGTQICVRWEDGSELRVKVSGKSTADMQCVTMSWNVSAPQKDTTPMDCYDMSHSHWYAGFEGHYQLWPINTTNIPLSPYVTGEIFSRVEYGEVVEPLLLSSLGMGIHVDPHAPLYMAVNGRSPAPSVCLQGSVAQDSPFYRLDKPWLRYDLCRAADVAVLWQGMSQAYLPKPQAAPSMELVEKPIWSTWARFKAGINQTMVLRLAREIAAHNLTASQLEIDDDWTPSYGDFTFNAAKFPNPLTMVQALEKAGIRTTVWMHPFLNTDSKAYSEASSKGYLVMEENSNLPARIDWWRGNESGMIDFTNPKAVGWYLGQLEKLKTDFNVTSFKFDAGEVTYLPRRYKLHATLDTPNQFTTRYVEAACQSDLTERRQEVRVGFRSQGCHTLVRMLDRASDWSHKLGLRTLIPTALAFGLAGYPFVLPDMIGGNAYNGSDIDQTVLPQRELYVRWLQTTLFMPTLQFSVAPWDYDAQVVAITQDMMALRAKYVPQIKALLTHAQKTGEPVVRPLWWADPLSEDALTCETEFLMGDDLLVAPVLEEGATSRDIYFPPGVWVDQLRGGLIIGGAWRTGYKAGLAELPHFTRFIRSGGLVG